jgi:homoserine dehydrogenase
MSPLPTQNPPLRIALLGHGNVARALVRLLLRKQDELRAAYDFDWRITGALSRRLGAALDPAGLDPQTLLDPVRLGPPMEALDFIARCTADVLIELSVLNPQTGQPAVDHVRAALAAGRHVVTANKGPLAFAYRELRDLAAARGRAFLFESTVMDGAPIFSLARTGLRGATLTGFRGILNSTTNYVLGLIEEGRSFDKAVAQAQAIGIAEADPSNDLDGWDASVKTVVLANVLMGADARPADVERTGIRELPEAEVRAAPDAGFHYKLVCSATRENGTLRLSVAPAPVPLSDPLAAVQGTSSIVTFYSDVLPELTIVEGHPGVDTTAFGVLADLLAVARGT